MDKIVGRVIKVGDNVNTDVLSPGRWMRLGMDVLKLHTMEAIRPKMYEVIQKGDVLVGGRNFGCGSHRDMATTVIKELGMGAVVADSVARIYFRNCISYGLPVVACDGVSKLFEEGDQIQIDMTTAEIVNTKTGKKIVGKPLPDAVSEIVNAGGMMPLLVKKLKHQ